jgi:mannonate dehydratase
MNRRAFISRSGAGAAAAAAAFAAGDVSAGSQSATAQKPGRTRALMKVGASTANAYDQGSLNAVLRYGVKNITAGPRIADEGRLYATVEELMKMRELPDKMGVSIDVLTPPNLASSHIDRERNPGIMLGTSPERDREDRSRADDDQELRGRGHPVHQVQHEHSRRVADRSRAGPR